ncbi:MAG: hypothetical protein ABI304_01990 [Rudaea sp.]
MNPALMIESAPAPPTVSDAASACQLLALIGVNIACAELDRYALQTDSPDWRMVDAADWLDIVHALLAGEEQP